MTPDTPTSTMMISLKKFESTVFKENTKISLSSKR